MPNEEFEGLDLPIVEIPDGLEDTIFHRAFTETPTLSDDIVPDLYSEEEVIDDSPDDVALDIDTLDDDAESDDHVALDDADADVDVHHHSADLANPLGDDFDFSGGTEAAGGVDGVDGVDDIDDADVADSIDSGDDLYGGL